MIKPWLAQRAIDRSDAPAFSVGDRTFTYGEAAREVERRAARLAGLGIERGAKVGLRAENSLEWILAAHAVFWRGATLVPLHPRGTQAELAHQLSEVSLDLLLVDRANAPADTGETPTLPLDELAAPEEARCRAISIDLDDPLTVLFTSGTTGAPKAVPLTAQNHLSSATASALRLGLCEDDHWLCCLPLCHIGGLAITLRSAIYGTSFELLERFSAERVLETLESRRVTLASFVPTMVHRLLETAAGPIDSTLRAVLVGGGPIDAEMLANARELGLPGLPTYGMTEACSQLATLSPHAGDSRLDTAGKALEGVQLRVEHPDRSRCAPGESGAIWARGPMLTDGYLNCPDENAERFRDGWFRTGDVGHLTEDGYLRIEHRKSDLIVTGGENVDPGEVEAVLRAAPSLSDVAVVGVDDSEWGEVVGALVVPTEPGMNDASLFEHLDELCRRELAAFKAPRRWMACAELPRTHSGKLDRAGARRLLLNQD